MPRRIDRDRRRSELAEALWRVILRRGIGAVSVRSVAEEAGVAVGSLRHVFPTRAELLEFSAELTGRRATERILAIPRSEAPRDYAFQVLAELLPLGVESRAEMEVNIALIAETPALPALVGIRDRIHEEMADACVQVVEILTGRPRDGAAAGEARRLHALVDGLALHLVMRPPSDGEWALDILREEIGRIEVVLGE